MNKAIHKLRLFLCTFSGEDDYIIRRCETRIQLFFGIIGGFVIFVFASCWASATFFMYHLFEGSKLFGVVAGVFIGIIWAMLVTNLYLLILYTVSPAMLPVAINKKLREKKMLKKENTKVESAFTPSFIFRISILVLLATITVQPFNVLIFSQAPVESHKYAGEISEILSSNLWAWIITTLGCLLFMLPIYLKYTIRNMGGFYEKKKDIEEQFVKDDYCDFKTKYASLLTEKMRRNDRLTWGNLMPYLNKLEEINGQKYDEQIELIKAHLSIEPITKYEYWADPPFRTEHRKVLRNLSSEQDFLANIYPTES